MPTNITTTKAGSSTLLSLGSFVFSVATAAFDNYALSSSFGWKTKDRVDTKTYPSLEYTGEEIEKLNLSGTLFPEYTGGIASLDTLRAMARKGVPYPLVDAHGRSHGKWAIKSISDERSFILSNGAARKITFKLALERHT